MKARRKLTSTQLKEWRNEVIGRSWEIYWEPEATTTYPKEETTIPSTPSTLTTSSDGTPIIETDEDDNSSYDADWYDGLITSYDARERMFEVVFVGDDTVYKMNLKPETVRPLEPGKGAESTQSECSGDELLSSQHLNETLVGESCLNWKQHLVGNDKVWEIYWDIDKTAVFVKDQKNVEFDADWYEGKVQSYSAATDSFQVSFTGEDCVYEMHLGPRVVRPSANAWIKRTRYLLSVNTYDVEWSCQLPPTPATYDIALRIDESDRVNNCCGDDSGSDSVSLLSQKIEEQIFLHEHLTIDPEDVIDDDASPKIRIEQYIKHLLRCLDVHKKACNWYLGIQSILKQTSCKDDESIDNRTNDEPGLQGEVVLVPLDVNEVYKKLLLGLHLYVRLITMNTDASADVVNTKKRQLPLIQNSTARAKKRRKRSSSARYRGFFIDRPQRTMCLEEIIDTELSFDSTSNLSVWDSVTQWLDENVDDEILSFLPSTDIFDKLQGKLDMNLCRSRLLTHILSDSIRLVLSSMWDKVLHWLLTSNKILLCRNLPFEQGPLYVDDSGPETIYKISDIQQIITSATTDSTLQRFNLSRYKSKLTEKINEIQAFECKVWSIIATCTNNDVKLPSDNNGRCKESNEEQLDHTICELKKVHNEMEDNPLIRNTSPIGHLTKKCVDDAIELRMCVIHFHRIQSYRERVSLITSLQSSMLKKFHVHHRPTQEAISQELGKMRHVLNQRWIEFDRIIKPQLPLDALEYDCESQCDKVLQSLNQHKVITACEEKLTILADILALKQMIQNILNATPEHKVDFERVESAFNLLNDIKAGKSDRRNQLTQGLLPNNDFEIEILAFTREKLGRHLGTSEQNFVDLYHFGRTWTQAVRGMMIVLKVDDVIQGKAVNIFGKVQMVDFAKVNELVQQHKDSIVSNQSYFEKLSHVQSSVVSWITQLMTMLPPSQVFCPFRCRSQLTSLQSIRPKGILMHPPRHLVDSWIELLTWYEDCTAALDDLKKTLQTTSEQNIPILSSTYTNIETFIFRGLQLIKEPSIDTFQTFLSSDGLVGETTKNSSEISLEKMNIQTEGQRLLKALVDYDRELGFHGVIAMSRILMWEQAASNLMRPSCHKTKAHLKDATSLLQLFETPNSSDLHKNNILNYVLTNTYSALESRTRKFQQVETNAISLLNSLANLSSPNVKHDILVDLIERMKAVRDDLKSPHHGFRVERSIEVRINQKIRDAVWFVNLFKYPALIENIDLNHIPNVSVNLSLSKKISSQDFFVICDKMPQLPPQSSASNGSFDTILGETCAKLIKMKTMCNEWEARVQNKLPLSTRGLKRRRKVIPEIKGRGNDKSSHLITRDELQELTAQPILDVVDLPLHSVVQRVLENVTTIENELNAILTSDIDSDDIDRTPIPTSPSLLGDDGEFFLFKLIGGNIFLQMQQSLHRVDALFDELDDIKTSEVITMQWISTAVRWVESLSSQMVFGKNGKLELSLPKAEELAVSGASILLGVEDVVRKCILRHKISLYTNDKTRNFSVKVARGGITHSIGAYVLRWIEYCFNGLRGDIYETYRFTQSVENFPPEDGSYEEAIESMSDIRANLFVSPTKETNEYFAHLFSESKKYQKAGVKSSMKRGGAKKAFVNKFDHNLIFE